MQYKENRESIYKELKSMEISTSGKNEPEKTKNAMKY
jgi:hypothetical protein